MRKLLKLDGRKPENSNYPPTKSFLSNFLRKLEREKEPG